MSSAARQQFSALDEANDATVVNSEALIARIQAEIERLNREESELRASARDIETVWNCANEFLGPQEGGDSSTSKLSRRGGSGTNGGGTRNRAVGEWLTMEEGTDPIPDIKRLRGNQNRQAEQDILFRLPSGESVVTGKN